MGWWRSVFTRRKSDLDDEIQSHIAMAIQDRIDRGESPEVARAAVMREFGNVPLVKDVVHQMWIGGWFDRLIQDLGFALRKLRKSPGFAITVILTVALSIGANTAIFSLAYALLLRSLPIPRPDRLVQLQLLSPNAEPEPFLTSALYKAVKERQHVFSGVCAWQSYGFNGEQNGDGRLIDAASVSGDCFATLGLHAFAGRLLTPEDDRSGSQTAVISYAWWQRRFHSDPNVIGQHVTMVGIFSDLQPITIVGVLPPSFQSVLVGSAPAVYVPFGQKYDNYNQSTLIFARLTDQVTARQAEEQLAPGFRSWVAALPANQRYYWLNPKDNPRLTVKPSRAGYSEVGNQYKKPLILLQSLAGILLLASCAYLGTLISARSVALRREIGLRAALGASRARLIRQLFSESLLLTLAGSALGVFFAWIAGRFLLTFVRIGLEPPSISVGLGREMLLFTVAITTLDVITWGLVPVLRDSRIGALSNMRSGQSSLISGRPPRRIGRWLVPLQIALSLVVVVVAGLLSTTLVRLLNQDNGYRMRGAVFASNDFPMVFGKENAAKIAAELELQRAVLDRLNHAPGISSASVGMIHVLSGGAYMYRLEPTPSGDDDYDIKSQTIVNTIGSRYFEILGTRRLKGRDFNDADTASSQRVCILTRSAEHRFFPHSDAVGRTLYELEGKKSSESYRIIGVVDDMRSQNLREDAPPIVYFDFTQMSEARNLEFVMKTDDPATAIASLRDILGSIAPGVHVTSSITMEEQVGVALSRERLLATLSNFFAGLGLLLGAISLYGILSYSVNCRTAEIGVRMALGASRENVVRMIVGEAARLVVPGIIIGAMVCVATTRLLHSLLYETGPLDPAAASLSLAAIVAIVIAASWLPARKASRVNPMEALRTE